MLLIKQKYHFNSFSNPFEMADENEKVLMELMRKNENSICADCRRKGKWSFEIAILFWTLQQDIIISFVFENKCLDSKNTYIIIK